MYNPKNNIPLHLINDRAVCPVCKARTQLVVRPDTVLINFPFYCKKCRQTSLVCYGEPEPKSLSHDKRSQD